MKKKLLSITLIASMILGVLQVNANGISDKIHELKEYFNKDTVKLNKKQKTVLGMTGIASLIALCIIAKKYGTFPTFKDFKSTTAGSPIGIDPRSKRAFSY